MGYEGLSLEEKIERVEEIRQELEQAETMDPATVEELYQEGMELLENIEQAVDIGSGEIKHRQVEPEQAK
jgi:hypothetical protein